MSKAVSHLGLLIYALSGSCIIFALGMLMYRSFVDDGASRIEVVRITSPDQRHDAVVIQTEGGATNGFGSLIHVVSRGQAACGEPELVLVDAMRNPDQLGVGVRWSNVGLVHIDYYSARELRVREGPVMVRGSPVEIKLRKGVRTQGPAPRTLDSRRDMNKVCH